MRYEEIELFEQGDKVRVDNCSDYCGMKGTVVEDQIAEGWDVIVKLENKEVITVDPYELVYEE